MTRHNLASNISWLLSNQVTPPVGVHTGFSTSATLSTASADTIYAEFEEEDVEEQNIDPLPPSPSPTRRITASADAVAEFPRPPLPPRITSNPPTREPPKTSAEEPMGRLSSASRSVRPGLVSQQQLATPASTTGSAMGSTPSLMQTYAKQCQNKNGEFKHTIGRCCS